MARLQRVPTFTGRGVHPRTSKLEALEAYQRYQMDDDTGTFRRLIEDDREHAKVLLEALRTRLARA